MGKEAADDLKYLRGLPTAPHKIPGSVFRYTAPENPGAKATRGGIPAAGQESKFEALVAFSQGDTR